MFTLWIECWVICFIGVIPKEDIVARCFAKHGLRLNVEMSYGCVGDYSRYPYIKPESFIKALDRAGKLDKFLGLGEQVRTIEAAGPSLTDFWNKFKLIHGTHQVFELAASGRVKLHQCVPVYLHGDEGTTYKKDGCLCMSMHCPLGRGTLSNKLGPVTDGVCTDPHLNFVGHAFETRFLLGALLKES